ncbi:hypothetical protein [Streptomyces sp. NPDC060035]|uniref:hypothetical protein n=1 Tax=Streptomyces sp. NPDC060035 TaxID=3347044 RepID=UPI003678CF82
MPDDMPDPLNARTPKAWIGPLVSTVATLPAAGLTLFFGGLAPMACDSCEGAQEDRFTRSFDSGWAVLCTGLLLALAVLVASWAPAVAPAARRETRVAGGDRACRRVLLLHRVRGPHRLALTQAVRGL